MNNILKFVENLEENINRVYGDQFEKKRKLSLASETF